MSNRSLSFMFVGGLIALIFAIALYEPPKSSLSAEQRACLSARVAVEAKLSPDAKPRFASCESYIPNKAKNGNFIVARAVELPDRSGIYRPHFYLVEVEVQNNSSSIRSFRLD